MLIIRSSSKYTNCVFNYLKINGKWKINGTCNTLLVIYNVPINIKINEYFFSTTEYKLTKLNRKLIMRNYIDNAEYNLYSLNMNKSQQQNNILICYC